MTNQRWALAFLVVMCLILGTLSGLLLSMVSQQRTNVNNHRIRNEAVHDEVLEFLSCALALPERTEENLVRCRNEAARKIEGTYPPEGRP